MTQQQLVVLVGYDQWRVAHFNGWRYQAVRTFSANAESQKLLLDWLKQFARANVYFLTDIADEHYHIEVLPPVRGIARKQLLARRLAAWPFAQGLHAVHKVDSIQGVRPEYRYLFSAIQHPTLREWLQALQKETLCVQGVYTQALCTPCWASNLLSGHTQCLIAYFGKQQLRIRYLYRSKLLFNRLLTLAPDESLGIRISREIAQTRVYLLSQKWLQESEPLQVLWLSEDEHSHGLPLDQLPATIKQICTAYADVMRQSGWQLAPGGLGVMDWAAIQVIRHTRQLPNFAPEASLLNASVVRAKRNITLTCVLMVCLFVMAHWISQKVLQKTHVDIQRTNAQLKLWQAVKPALGIVKEDLPRLQTFSRAVQSLESSARFPNRALTILQDVMAGQPMWQVKEVGWHYGATHESRHKQAALPDNHWTEASTIKFSRQKAVNSSDAYQAWQALLEKLRQHPDVLELKEMNASVTSGSSIHQGDTRQSLLLDDQPALTIKLREPKGAAT